jgi:eukaryotic-like serine/threonine-protein kinase
MANQSIELGDERGSNQDDAVGEELPRQLGRVMLLKRIARGGMGEVLLASTMGIEGAERPVIVKIIRREHKTDPNFYARFLDETRVQAQLSHTGVAQVLDAAIDERTGEPYAIVEHVEGKSLGEVRSRALQIGHRMTWADGVALSLLMAEGLAHIHERKDAAGKPLAIVHRDLSPQNVMVSFHGEVKIIDFGTARGQNRRCHTVSGVVFAKPGYVAPEVANGDSGDARVDLYALGVMLWELCAGRRFLQGDAQHHLARVSRNEQNLPKIADQCGAPEDLDAVIAKLTAFDRDTRYLAARAAATDLAKLLASAPALPTGERGVRQRAAHLLHALFPGEPLASRKEFARLIAAARAPKPSAATSAQPRNDAPPPLPAPKPSAPPAPAPEAPLDLEGSRYRAIREIGRGASSVVLEAEQLGTKKRVAVKVLAGAQATQTEAVERFRRGARALSLLDHENLVRVHDVGLLAGGRPFCAMDLYEGETLKEHLAREKGADFREALGLASKILAALEVAHSAGIVHRDIQPANIFLPSGGGLRVLDFGLAAGRAIAMHDVVSDAVYGPARDVVIHGTPEYMAPEQATSGEVDGRADLYGVGCILFEMLTGRLPFEGPSEVAILDQKRKGSPPRPSEIAPSRGIPEAVSAVVMKALARHPGSRFQSATEMRRAIDVALSGGRASRSRWIGAIAAVTAVLSFAGGVGLARSETLRTRVPARVAEIFTRQAPSAIEPEAPAPAATDLSQVPLGEVAMDAPAADAPAAGDAPPPSADELAAIEDADPALEDPAEHDEVLTAGIALADADNDSGDVPAQVQLDAPEPAKIAASPAPAPAPVKRRQVRHAAPKAAPKPAPVPATAPAPKAAKTAEPPSKTADATAKPAKPESGAALHPTKDLKDMAPPKDEDAARKKK